MIPTVLLTLRNPEHPEQVSFLAFSESGEILETVETRPDGSPDWADAGICDDRSGGGPEAFEALHRALTAAEENARRVGLPIRRINN